MPLDDHDVLVLLGLEDKHVAGSGAHGDKIVALLVPGELVDASPGDGQLGPSVFIDSFVTVEPTIVIQFKLENLDILNTRRLTFFPPSRKVAAAAVEIDRSNVALDLQPLDHR